MQHGVEVLDEYPLAGLLATVVVATLVYVVFSYLLDGAVVLLELAVFVAIFTAVYVAVGQYLED